MRLGIGIGISCATVCVLIAGVVAVLSRSNPFSGYGMSFGRGVLTYYATAVVVGAVGGSMAPIARWPGGVMCIGAVCGVLSEFGLGIGEGGLRSRDLADRFGLIWFAALGAALAPYLRSVIRRQLARNWKAGS